MIRVYWNWGFRGITLLSTNLHSTFALILGLEAYFSFVFVFWCIIGSFAIFLLLVGFDPGIRMG